MDVYNYYSPKAHKSLVVLEPNFVPFSVQIAVFRHGTNQGMSLHTPFGFPREPGCRRWPMRYVKHFP